jgi:hypothetical protein
VASDVVVTEGFTLTMMVSDFPIDATPLVSVATTVNVCEVAVAPTLPEITPELAVKLSPVGSEPVLTLQAIGLVPPVEVRVCEYPAWPWVAVANEVVVTDGGTFTVMVSDLVPATRLASVATAVKVCDVAVAPTVPEITPVFAVKLSPVGSEPLLRLQVIAPVPPVDASVCEYPVCVWVAVAIDVVVTDGLALTVMVSDLPVEATPLVSVATTVNVCDVALLPRVPEITPVPAARFSPAGSEPVLMVHAIAPVPPLEVRVCEYPVCVCVAVASDVVVTDGGAFTVSESELDEAAAPWESVTVRTSPEVVPVAVGVPWILPFEVSKLSPAGIDPVSVHDV